MTTSKTILASDQIRESWNRIAPDFDRFTTPIALPMGEAALDRVGLEPGMRFLDIAAGSGALALPASRRGARVLATDIAPAMIERLRKRAREEGLTNLEARVMDGQSLDLEDDGFDVSASLNGVSLFPDLDRGLREMVRVTRPGGRAMIVAFGPLPSVEFVNFFIGALTASVSGFRGLPTDPPPLPFQLADGEKLRRAMAGAGLSAVHVEAVDWPMEFRSASDYWDAITSSNPIAVGILASLTDEQVREVRWVTDGMLRERGGNGRSVLHNRVNVGIGTK
jgi:ubiquinone/menaquinone biosynthesis C-methylase UbiE